MKNAMRSILITVLLLLCGVLFYVLIIMGDAPMEDEAILEPLARSEQVESTAETSIQSSSLDLRLVEQHFGGQAMMLSDLSGWRLEGTELYDHKPRGIRQTIWTVKLDYVHDASGTRIAVSSSTPLAVIQSLPSLGFSVAEEQGFTIGSLKAVLMEKGGTLNVHATRDDVAYQIEGEVDAATLQQIANMVDYF